MKTETKKAEMPEWFEKHPLTEKIKQDRENERIAKRKTAYAQLQVIDTERQKVVPGLQTAFDKKMADYEAIKEKLARAETEIREARTALNQRKTALDCAYNRQRALLLESVDKRLTDAEQFFRKKLDELRKMTTTTDRAGAGLDMLRMTKKIEVWTNRQALLSALEYCQKSLEILDGMKLLPEYDAGSVEKLKKGIPDPTVMARVEGIKEVKGLGGVDIGSLRFPSPGAIDATVDKLIKKADAIKQAERGRK